MVKNIKKNTNIWDKKILVILEKNQKFTFIKYLSKNYGAKIQASFSWTDGSLGISDYRGSEYEISGDELITRVMVTFSF